MTHFLLFFLFCFCALIASFAFTAQDLKAHEQLNYQFGYRQFSRVHGHFRLHSRPFLRIEGQKESEDLWFVRSDVKILGPNTDTLLLDVDELTVGTHRGNWILRVGASEYSFGESFGQNPFDSINPRDRQYSLFDDVHWYKLSVWAMDFQYFAPSSSWQLIWIPRPLTSSASKEGPDIGEYFFRYGKLWENGIDSNLLIGHHHSRELLGNQQPVWALSGSGSFIWRDLVVRADWRYVWQELMPTHSLFWKKVNHWQAGFGVDGSWEQAHLGFQLLYEDYRDDCWASGMVDYAVWNQRVIASVQLAYGLLELQREALAARWQLVYAQDKGQGKIYFDKISKLGSEDRWGIELLWSF